MDHSAGVRSIDAVRKMAVALQAFGDNAGAALADMGMNVHRALQWIQYDQREYWTAQLRRGQYEVEEARLNLERKLMNRIGDHEPACREEKVVLEAAKRRVLLAREKLEAVHRWSRQLEHELVDHRSAVAPLGSWLQTELPKALAALSMMSRSLEAYAGDSCPQESATDAPPSDLLAAENGRRQPPSLPTGANDASDSDEISRDD